MAVAALAAGTGAALADPPSGTTVNPTDIVAVGSDTTQSLFDQWSTDYNTANPSLPHFYSYDATGTSPITTKTGCSAITRPNGSGAGISALQAGATTGSSPCIDIARSSRTLQTSDGTGLAEVAIARDLITQSSISGGHGVSNISTAELHAIYACDATLLPAGDTTHTGPVKWSDLVNDGGTSTNTIVPVLPQTSSGTRSTWLLDIGETYTSVAPSCVVNGVSSVDGSVIEENEGTNSEFTTANASVNDVLFPYSGGAYVGEVFKHTNPQSPGNLTLRNINGTAPLTSSNTINVPGFSSTFIRTLFADVKSTGASPWVPTNLQHLLGASNSTGFVCGTTGKADVANAGFAAPSLCGAVVAHQ